MSNNEPVRGLLVTLDPDDPALGVRISDVFSAVGQLRLKLLGLGLICVLSVIAIYALADKEYRATTTIILATQSQGSASLGALSSQLGGLASLAGISLSASDGLREEAFATLESRQLLREFILEDDLKPILFSRKWNSASSTWETEDGQAPSTEKAITFFQDEVLQIRREPNQNIVKVSIRWEDPSLCMTWANELVDRVNEGLRNRTKLEATKSIEFLEKAVAENSNAALQNAVYSLIEQQMAKIVMANVRSEFAFSVIDRAVAPDADNPVWPRLVFFLIAGFAAWILLGGALVLIVALRMPRD